MEHGAMDNRRWTGESFCFKAAFPAVADTDSPGKLISAKPGPKKMAKGFVLTTNLLLPTTYYPLL